MNVNDCERMITAAGHGSVIWSASNLGRPICAVWGRDGVRRWTKADTMFAAAVQMCAVLGISTGPPPPPPETGTLTVNQWNFLLAGGGLTGAP